MPGDDDLRRAIEQRLATPRGELREADYGERLRVMEPRTIAVCWKHPEPHQYIIEDAPACPLCVREATNEEKPPTP